MQKVVKKFLISLLSIIFSAAGSVGAYATINGYSVSDISIIEKSPTITVEEPTIADEQINGSIRFNQLGDFVTYGLTLVNNSSERCKVASISDNNMSESLALEYGFSDEYVSANSSTTLTLKLSYIKQLINQNLSLDNLAITINFEQEDGDTGQIVFVPDTGIFTGDETSLSSAAGNIIAIVLIVALVGVSIVLIIRKRTKSLKIGILLLAISTFFIPFAAFAREKFVTVIKFSELEVVGEFEKYNVLIDADNGSTPISREITYGEPVGELPMPEKAWYDFDRWEDLDGNEITSETIITGETHVLAKYQPKDFAISYNLNGGTLSVENPEKYTIEDDDIVLNEPERVGYIFTGWTGSNGETPEKTVTISAGSTDDKEYTANYTPRTDIPYTVAHGYQNLNYDWYYEGEDEPTTYYGTADSIIDIPLESKYGFEDPEVQTVKIEPDGSTEVVYHYDRKNFSFSVTNREDFESDCQWHYRCTDDGAYPYETTIRLKAKKRTGYHITWNDNSPDYEREFPLTEDIVMSFTYAPNHYTVRYDKNADDAIGEMEDQEFTYDEEQALHSNEFTRTGYTFGGWGHPIYPNGWHIASENWETKNLTDEDGAIYTFYASWNPVRVRVEYYDSEHNQSYWINSDHFYDEKVPLIPFTPSKSGYDLAGYYADAEYTIPMDFENTILKGDFVVYIKFTPKTD